MVQGIEDPPARAAFRPCPDMSSLYDFITTGEARPVHGICASQTFISSCERLLYSRPRVVIHQRCRTGRHGGASRNRTDDPLLAKQVLSQLSYGPKQKGMVGRGGLEPPTSRLSVVRSNHLSYQPVSGRTA
jgi:hypothetical protein